MFQEHVAGEIANLGTQARSTLMTQTIRAADLCTQNANNHRVWVAVYHEGPDEARCDYFFAGVWDSDLVATCSAASLV